MPDPQSRWWYALPAAAIVAVSAAFLVDAGAARDVTLFVAALLSVTWIFALAAGWHRPTLSMPAWVRKLIDPFD